MSRRTIYKRILQITAGTLMLSSIASARVYLNSMCYMHENSTKKAIQGEGALNKKFELASISKMVTTLWAINKLGPDYRFNTKIYITPATSNSFNVHIQGSRDPIFGQNMGYFLISELNRLGISKIENLTFDENLLYKWDVEGSRTAESSTEQFETTAQQASVVRSRLLDTLDSDVNLRAYRQLSRQAQDALGLKLNSRPSLDIRRVEFASRSAVTITGKTKIYSLNSAPLRKILKKMNAQSNNYIADNLYWNLGGTDAFNKFAKARLDADESDIEFINGSGNNDGDGNYNMASCETMVKVMYALSTDVEKKGYKLQDVMAVAVSDEHSTVRNYGDNMAKAMTAKTGSVNPAKTLTGMVSTKKGDVFFTVLMHTGGRREWPSATNSIKSKVKKLIAVNGGPRRLNYSPSIFLPFDGQSRLVEVVTKAPPVKITTPSASEISAKLN